VRDIDYTIGFGGGLSGGPTSCRYCRYTLQLRDVAMETNFGTTLAENGFVREITSWGFRIKDSLFSVNPASVGRYLCIRSCGVRNSSRPATVILRLHDTTGCQTGCQTGLTTG